MLRPERMSKVSVTGAKRVMDDVIETVHGLNLLHLTDYNGSWTGFDPGNPMAGSDEAAEKLVTVRSIESILDIDPEDAGPARIVDDEELESELAEVRERVNELDDRRSEVESELRETEERLENMAPFARLGIDLDLLQGYDSLDVVVGEGDPEAVERAIIDADGLGAYEVFSGDGVVAAFARPAREDSEALSDALVGARFTALTVPDLSDVEDADGTSPEAYIDELERRRNRLESRLNTIESELSELKLETAGFVLAAEEELTIEVQKRQAPLSFATTENAFVAEGWIPTERYGALAGALQDAVGDHVEIEELERASFGADGAETLREQLPEGPAGGERGRPTAADGSGDAATDGGGNGGRADGDDGRPDARADGGAVVMRDDSPPVVQDNPDPVKPFEILTRAVGVPKYTELDPTAVLFLTFPAFFGFMIGDLGYGILYTAIGYYLYDAFESEAFKSMGGVTIAAGLFTMLFGILYGEFFGLHLITDLFWSGLVGLEHAPIEKGLSPATAEWARAWLVVSVLAGVVHLNVGYVFELAENLEFHGAKEAVLESGSWLLMLNGLWVFVFSHAFEAKKPEFLFHVFAGEPFGFGFAGFSGIVGFLGLGAFVLGLVLIFASGAVGEAIEALFLQVFVNGLSYTRLAAVLLAKAGMAFTVNLLFFGVGTEMTEEGAEWHFLLTESPQHFLEHHEEASILFPGMIHSGIAAVLVGLVILVLGHALVLALGVTSAGLQSIRLEYVEFFGKFYEGGGRAYDPFGRIREFTTED